jgi:RimJ/RimL family protein N-acetyltransferase
MKPLALTDAGFVKALFNDPDCLRFIGDKQLVDLPSAARYIENVPMVSYRQHGFGILKMLLKETNQSIGCCGLLQRDYLQGPDIGFAVLPAFRRQGFLYEAAQAMLLRVKEMRCYPAIDALVDPENKASIALLKKLGFAYQRKLNPPQDDRDTDVYVMIFEKTIHTKEGH